MNRTQWTLTGLLLFQFLLLLLIAAPWSSGSGASGPMLLLPALESFTPARIEISSVDDSLVLDREQDGWRIEQADGYPAEESMVDQLLDSLGQLQVRRPVVTSSRYHEALKVTADENERRLRIWESGEDDPRIDLFLGSSPNYGVNHVRVAGEDNVYEVRGLSPWDMRADMSSWIDKKLVDVAAESVVSLKLRNEHGVIELSRGEDGAWTAVPADSAAAIALDSSKVDSFVRALGSLRFSEPAGRIDGGQGLGFDSPAAELEMAYGLDGEASGVVELVVGGEADPDSGTRYASRAGSEFGVILSKWDADRLVDKKLDDLLVEEPTTEDENAPGS